MNREYLKEKDKYNFSIVHYSTRLNSEKVISTLYELNNDCFKDEQELSVLFEACIFGSTNVVNELINNDKYRVNINFIKISNNWTPLLVSVYGGRLDIVEKLLEKIKNSDNEVIKKSIDHKNDKGINAIAQSILNINFNYDIYFNIFKLLVKYGASVSDKYDFVQNDNTLLHTASRNNVVEAAQILLERGLSINERNGLGATPLHLAAYYGNEEMVKFLLTIKDIDISIRTRDGKTADKVASGDKKN